MTERRLTGVAARIDARIPRPEDFRSDLRGPGTAARAGTWLGVAVGVCFLTGLYSHLLQDPVARIPLPTAVPVLGRFGARVDNPTLLDRPDWAGYLAVVALALVVTAALALRRRARPSAQP